MSVPATVCVSEAVRSDQPEATVRSREASHRAFAEILRLPQERRPTAVFAGNDLSAHGAIDAIHEAGLRVPDDLSVVGYDDTWYSSITNPPLTSVNMNIEMMGRRAAQVLIESIDGRKSEIDCLLPVSLTVRGSTGPVRLGSPS